MRTACVCSMRKTFALRSARSMSRLQPASRSTRWNGSMPIALSRAWIELIGALRSGAGDARSTQWRRLASIAQRSGAQQYQEHQALEFGHDQLDQLGGLWHQLPIGDDSELDLTVVGEHAHAGADATGLRHPKEQLRHADTADVQLLAGAGQIRGDKTGFSAEQSNQGLLHRGRKVPERGQQPENDQRLRRALQCLHARTHRVQALEWMADADGQLHKYESEAI